VVRRIDGRELFDENEPFTESNSFTNRGDAKLEGINWHEYPNITTPRRRVNDPFSGSSMLYTPREHLLNSTPTNPRRGAFFTEGESGDYLSGINWGKLRPGLEADPNNANVSQQFLDRVNPLMDRMRSRPLGGKYVLTHEHPIGRNWADSTHFKSHLWHQDNVTGEMNSVGRVNWDGDTGHVFGLHVDWGHRHMTMKLLQEAHDSARAVNDKYDTEFHGPAASDQINEHSGPIVAKYNPESSDFGESSYAREHHPEHYTGDPDYDEYEDEEEDDDSRWDRLSDEAWQSHHREYGEECVTCRGAGMSRLVAVTGDQSSPWVNSSVVRGEVKQSRSLAFKEVATSTTYGVDSDGNDHEYEHEHPNEGRLFHKDYPLLNGYTRIAPWNLPRHKQDVQTWVKPCSSCGTSPTPGFPNASRHADEPSYRA